MRHQNLPDKERPELVKVIQWAAPMATARKMPTIYGKRRLAEIDRRIRFPDQTARCGGGSNPAGREDADQVFFGATVKVQAQDGTEKPTALSASTKPTYRVAAFPDFPRESPHQGPRRRRRDRQDSRRRRDFEIVSIEYKAIN
jgi:transcription elongation factor GreB